MLKLNLGCGNQVVPGWVNVDYALGARLATAPVLGAAVRKLGPFRMSWDPRIHIHDLTKPLPWPAGTVDAVYSSHTVEHMTRDDGRRLVAEAFRVLKPGGVLRVVVPDLEVMVRNYTAGALPAERFVEELGVMYGTDKRGLRRLLAPLVEFPHRCMYDHEAMLRVFRENGFEASRSTAFDSAIETIREIELEHRTEGAVIVEGRKPASSSVPEASS
jgi:predicted SAM-dependent methyltransferase